MIKIDDILHMDANDPLKDFKTLFHFPISSIGNQKLYFCGNSLGLQPKATKIAINKELEDWAMYGVEGHVKRELPWLSYHEVLTSKMAKIVGAKEDEVVIMNSLTVNIHLLFASFYKPTKERFKIVMESNAFPSDLYAVKSQIRFHGYNENDVLVLIKPKQGTSIIDKEDIESTIQSHSGEIALLFVGGVNYYSGQVYDIAHLSMCAKKENCYLGIDLAHAAGNIKLNLHHDQVDFAVWCSYKYLNSGPGSLGGIFVHQKHKNWGRKPRFEGWWGQDKATRFQMTDEFLPIPGAEGWQLSNPPILSMAAIHASLEIFDQAGMDALIDKSKQLKSVFINCLDLQESKRMEIITPLTAGDYGCQISIRIVNKDVFKSLVQDDFIVDWREPDVIRIAPVPLYNSFSDVFKLSQKLNELMLNDKV